MMTSTKLISTAAASILGLALAGGAAYAATGSLTATDAPGQVLQVSGVGPASAHASSTATANADANAKGLHGTDVSVTEGSEAEAGTDGTANAKSEQGIESSTNTATPVAPSTASSDASTVKGSATGESISAWAHAKTQVEAVAPDAAVSVGADVSVKAGD